MPLADTARNVGSVFAYDEWQISRYVAVGYGANYARYDYMDGPALFSPRFSATFSPTAVVAPARLGVARRQRAGRRRIPSADRRAEYLPPQRTFSPISKAGMRTQELQNYEVGVERVLNGAAIARARVRAAHRRSDRDGVRPAPRSDAASLGHYYVGSAGDADVRGVGVTFTHALAENIRGSVDYSMATANWTDRSAPVEYAVLTRWVPSAVRPATERIHDVTTSLETEIPYSATRVVVLYKLNNAFAARRSQRARRRHSARDSICRSTRRCRS